jgi:hypothetical protein
MATAQVEVQSGAHSDKLSDKDQICELVTHNVKPDCLDKYLKSTENLIGTCFLIFIHFLTTTGTLETKKRCNI